MRDSYVQTTMTDQPGILRSQEPKLVMSLTRSFQTAFSKTFTFATEHEKPTETYEILQVSIQILCMRNSASIFQLLQSEEIQHSAPPHS